MAGQGVYICLPLTHLIGDLLALLLDDLYERIDLAVVCNDAAGDYAGQFVKVVFCAF